jgi:hypothetical protein
MKMRIENIQVPLTPVVEGVGCHNEDNGPITVDSKFKSVQPEKD